MIREKKVTIAQRKAMEKLLGELYDKYNSKINKERYEYREEVLKEIIRDYSLEHKVKRYKDNITKIKLLENELEIIHQELKHYDVQIDKDYKDNVSLNLLNSNKYDSKFNGKIKYPNVSELKKQIWMAETQQELVDILDTLK